MEEIKMKDSGIKWIGKIPVDWNMKRAKYLFKERFGGAWGEDPKEDKYDRICIRIADFDYSRLKVKRNIDFTKRNYDKATISKATLKNKDLLIEKSGGGAKTPVGRVVLYDLNEKALFANFMDVLRVKDEYSAEYIKYLFYSMYAIGGTFFYVNQTTGIQNLNLSALLDNEMFPVFSKQEQQKIAEFLDKKCADIDEIISKTEKQIETLEQYKKSLITETVTKGLKNSKLINSDIKWIGEIPFDWNTKKIKYVATLKGRIGWQGLTSDEYQDEGPYLITGVDFLDGQINWGNCVHIPEKRWTEAVDIRIKENDLLITKDGTVGKVALVKNLKDKASLNSGVLLINLEEEYDKKYLFWVLQSDIFWKWFSYTNSGNSTIIHLYQHDFDNFEYPIPPMKEQKEIATFLDMKCEKTDKIIKRQKESLETLKKYKQSLIYEYVTGKKRV